MSPRSSKENQLHPDLEPLLALQERDKAVSAVKKAMDALRPEDEALDAELGAHTKALEDAERAASGAEARKAELEQRIAGYKRMQEQRRQQLDYVRGAKEASALMAELDLARGVLVKEETEYMRSGDLIVEAQKKVKDAQKNHQAVVAKQAEAREALAVKRAELATQLEAAEAERKAATKAVKQPLLVRYERIRRGRAPAALYPLRKDACGHCFTSVPMQRRVLIQQGQSIEGCEVCGVLLYAEE
jgi:predicted  nucleic acid-binding Zn-ribbon protein